MNSNCKTRTKMTENWNQKCKDQVDYVRRESRNQVQVPVCIVGILPSSSVVKIGVYIAWYPGDVVLGMSRVFLYDVNSFSYRVGVHLVWWFPQPISYGGTPSTEAWMPPPHFVWPCQYAFTGISSVNEINLTVVCKIFKFNSAVLSRLILECSPPRPVCYANDQVLLKVMQSADGMERRAWF